MQPIAVKFSIAAPRRKLQSSLVGIENDEDLEEVYARCMSVLVKKSSQNNSNFVAEHNGVATFSHQRSFALPVEGVFEKEIPVHGELSPLSVPVMIINKIYYGMSHDLRSYMMHLRLFIPCMDLCASDNTGKLFMYDNNVESHGPSPVRWSLASKAGNSSKKIILLTLRNWTIELDILGEMKQTLVESTDGSSDAQNDVSALNMAAIEGYAELHSVQEIQKKTYLVYNDSMLFDLLSADSLDFYSGFQNGRMIASDMQSIGNNILCSVYSPVCISLIEDGRKGKFNELNVIVPTTCITSVSFQQSKSSYKIWPDKLQEYTITKNQENIGGDHILFENPALPVFHASFL
jgi:hypothetical protein